MRYGARKGSKTRDFSHIWAEMCEKSRVFDTFWRAGRTKHSEGPKTRASRRQKISKTRCFSLFFGGGAQKSSFYLGKRDFLKIWSFSGRLATPIWTPFLYVKIRGLNETGDAYVRRATFTHRHFARVLTCKRGIEPNQDNKTNYTGGSKPMVYA